MDLIERIKLFFQTSPEAAKRLTVVLVILAVGIPVGWWFIRSAEEKAYVYFTNGYYSYRNKAYPQAVGSLGQLVAHHPNSKFTPMGRYYLALSQVATNNLDEAAGQFKFFMDDNPKHFLRERIYAIWMALEMSAGRPEKSVLLADQYFAEFGQTSQSAPEVLYRKGVALLQMGRPDEAGKCFEEAAPSKDNNIFGNLAFFAQTTRPPL